jgi:hypothetical protein
LSLQKSSVRAAVLAATFLAAMAPACAQEPAPGTDAFVEEALAKRRITLHMPETPANLAIQFVRDMTDVTVLIDPAIDTDAPLKLRLGEVTLKAAMRHITAGLGPDITYEVWRGAILITSKKTPLPEPSFDLTPAAKKALERKVSVNFPDVPLDDVIRFLSEIQGAGGVKLALAPGVETKVSLKMRDRSIEDVLAAICRLHALRLEKNGEDGYLLKKR